MIAEIELERIEPNPWQPRKNFPADSLLELGESIKKEGLKQAIGLRPHPKKKGIFQIIWGERRVRACRLVEMETIRADVLQATDLEMKKWAVLENRGREDTNPMEDARSTKMLMDSGMSIKEIAKSVGRRARDLENELVLLRLPDELQEQVEKKGIPKPLGMAIGALPMHLHMEAYKATQGKLYKAQLNIIYAMDLKSKNVLLFELTPEQRKEVIDSADLWKKFKKLSMEIVTIVNDKPDVAAEIASGPGDLNFMRLLVKVLKILDDRISKKHQIKRYGG
jgi:ParB/RepB/Spo0J family partition protein